MYHGKNFTSSQGRLIVSIKKSKEMNKEIVIIKENFNLIWFIKLLFASTAKNWGTNISNVPNLIISRAYRPLIWIKSIPFASAAKNIDTRSSNAHKIKEILIRIVW